MFFYSLMSLKCILDNSVLLMLRQQFEKGAHMSVMGQGFMPVSFSFVENL